MQIQESISVMSKEPSRAELVQRIDALESLVRRRSLMMKAAGHDLRQPLQTILAAIERVSAPQCRQGTDFWRKVAMEQVARLNHGLAELMMASNEEDPYFNAGRHPLPIASLFAGLESEWSHAAEAKHLFLRFVPSSALVMCDPGMLRTMLTNLIGNAVKYTEEGGIVVGCRKRGDALAIDVVDTGCGFDAALQQRMFDAFAQGQHCQEGFGIGLWLVQRLARIGGHALQFWSQPGFGSRFRISLPVAPAVAMN